MGVDARLVNGRWSDRLVCRLAQNTLIFSSLKAGRVTYNAALFNHHLPQRNMYGWYQYLAVIAVIVVLLFGTKKLGSIGSDLGASIKGFKKAMSDDEPKQDKTSQDADFTAKTIADKQADTNQEQAKTADAKRHDKEQG